MHEFIQMLFALAAILVPLALVGLIISQQGRVRPKSARSDQDDLR